MSTATVNQVIELVCNHPAGHLIVVQQEMFAGAYSRIYPGKLSVEGNDWTFSTYQTKTIRTLAGVKEYLDGLVPNISQWQESILKRLSFHTAPDSDHQSEGRFVSAEKLFFCFLGTTPNRKFIVGDYEISFWFGVTSFKATVSVRASFCPEAFGEPGGAGFRNDSATFISIGEYVWGENGSGFNRKFQEAIAFLKRFVNGDWTGVEAFYQNNRSVSRSASGESHTRFWAAQLTYPDLAKAKTESKGGFPLFSSRLIFP
jgi:hypothetical protein